jgi:sulfur-carrier protein adenylyltransferase/sulfurtransferase
MMEMKEIARYQRHLLLPEIGAEGQEKLKKARVLVVGAGGLGCPVLQYLCAAGVGTIGIVDADVVELSNLQRQVLFNQDDIGKPKADLAAEKLGRQNPFVKFNVHRLRLDKTNALDIIREYDLVVDGSDNFATRYMVSDACVLLQKPLVYGAVYRFEGQVAVFNLTTEAGRLPATYRCAFPEPATPEQAPDCSTAGVLGVLPGIIGSLQANEVIKIITGAGETLQGKLLLFNALTMNFTKIKLDHDPANDQNRPQSIKKFLEKDYTFACAGTEQRVRNITVRELTSLLLKGENLQFLDVREHGEPPEVPQLSGLKIPLDMVQENKRMIPRNKKVVVYCRGGSRSTKAVLLLQQENFKNLYNLEGGILKWTEEYALRKYENN